MIEVRVDPAADGFFDRREVDDHAERVEPASLQGDDRAAIVPVQMATLAVVIEKSMTIAKANLARDLEHGVLPIVVGSLREPDPRAERAVHHLFIAM